MLRKPLLSLVATLMALTAIGVAPPPATEAFGEQPFIQVWNANHGVVMDALERYLRVPSRRLEIRLVREIARAENRIVVWLQQRPATACQRPWAKAMIARGIMARKSFKAAARALVNKQDYRATTLVERGMRFHTGMYDAGAKMLQICP
jgi:hypothetical protein